MADKEKESAEVRAKGGSKKWLMLGVLILLLVGGGVASAVIAMNGQGGETQEEPSTSEEIHGDAGGKASETPAQGEKKEAKAGGHGQPAEAKAEDPAADHDATPATIFKFEKPFVVNLFEPGGRRFLNLELQVKGTSPEVVERIEQNLAPLQDTIIMLLSSKTMDDLNRIEGKLKLKQEIIIRMEGVLGPGTVESVYFTDFNILYN